MPLKDKEKRNEASKTRMQKMRKGVTKQGVTDVGVTDPSATSSNHAEDPTVTSKDNPHTETVPASYVQGITGKFKSLPKRARFLTLSDGQVFDRLNQPIPNKSGDQAMQACNEGAYNFKPNQSSKERIKELTKGI